MFTDGHVKVVVNGKTGYSCQIFSKDYTIKFKKNAGYSAMRHVSYAFQNLVLRVSAWWISAGLNFTDFCFSSVKLSICRILYLTTRWGIFCPPGKLRANLSHDPFLRTRDPEPVRWISRFTGEADWTAVSVSFSFARQFSQDPWRFAEQYEGTSLNPIKEHFLFTFFTWNFIIIRKDSPPQDSLRHGRVSCSLCGFFISGSLPGGFSPGRWGHCSWINFFYCLF